MAVTKLPGSQINTVTAVNLSTDAVESSAIKDGAVIAGKLAAASINASNLFDSGVVDAAAIADNAVTSTAISAGAVIAGKIGNNAVTTATVAANAITAAKLNSDVAGGGLVLDNSTNAINVNLGSNSGLQVSSDALSLALDGQTLQTNSSGVSVNQSAAYNFSSLTGTLSSNLSANNFKITAVAAPTTGTDVANKAYVDSVAQGLDVKYSCMVATTGALPSSVYSNGTNGVGATLTGSANGALGSIDGVSIAATGLRILVKNQANAFENGIYVVTTLGDASTKFVITRASDFNSSANISSGAFTFIEQGTIQSDTGWVLTTDGLITVGTTGLDFAQFAGAGAVIAGNGLTRSGNTISALLNSGASGNIVPSISITASGLSIKVDNSSISIDGASQLQVKAGGITSGMVANGAIGTNQLANSSVVTSKIADANVTAAKLNADVTVQLGALGAMGTTSATTGTDTITFANSATAADKDSALLVFLNGALLTPGGSGDYIRNVTNGRTTGFTLQRSGTTGVCTYFFGG